MSFSYMCLFCTVLCKVYILGWSGDADRDDEGVRRPKPSLGAVMYHFHTFLATKKKKKTFESVSEAHILGTTNSNK